MNNAEMIAVLRCRGKKGGCRDCPLLLKPSDACFQLAADAADLIEAQEKRIAELENDLMCGTVSEPERFGINGYSMKDLLLFAEMCKRNDVSEADLKQAAWNLELAVRAVMNERQEIVKNTMDEITMRFTSDFEKAYAEMMPSCGARMKGEQE